MKILQVYKDVFPEVSGGIERYLHDLSVFLKDRGHSVQILVTGGGFRRLEDIEVLGVPSPCRILSNPVAPGFSRFLSETDADVIHFHLPLPTAVIAWMMVRRKRRKPYIVTYHSDIVRQSFAMPLYGPILLRFLKGASRVIATSENYIRTSKYLNCLNNTEAIPIGVDLNRFVPTPCPTREYYLFVGRFRRYKGIFVLLEAWRRISNPPKLILAGGGLLADKIEKFARKYKLPVSVVCNANDRELIDLYQNARALILPSVQRSEAFGMVQVEAMACGTPVISSNLPTGVSWVNRHNETGFLFPPGIPDELKKAVLLMENSPEIRENMSLKARERAENQFSCNALFERVEECLIKAIEI